ncbi:TPA: RNA-directed DNA polymerase [Clostridium botulinum]|uniref:RNA-directed DNA polymerase n=1 Tax=Clostridium sp. TaxID=1506 RepID=UPI001D4F5914|nr:RNA-directed DNA polymerase [Clostridium sp.]MDU7253061.1 RNA-directed DNA polymerase [Clostridium sp.]HBJ2613925.1 RNA-directed DNA polymerase [Clostridium botulinum]
MQKTYINFMNEITANKLYHGLLAHGFFSEKFPPFLTSENFFDYCEKLNQPFSDKEYQYIYYESMRNINVTRQLGIPNPFAYQRLCKCLSDNWDKLKQHFEKQTSGQNYKISRIHIRKLKDKPCLFEMNYNNWKIDGSPEPDLLIGKRYLVKADISTCFPSIYTHSIPWALIGKEKAKGDRDRTKWYNKIDHFSQNVKNGETHGLIIGPHASNLLSELILTVVDRQLYEAGWKHIRNIDDYTCYVSTYEEGQQFLTGLNTYLRNFDLSLNCRKTEILELPMPSIEQWVRQVNSISLVLKNKKVDFKIARGYLDFAVELMQNNNKNSAILNYAIKVLSKQSLTDNAKAFCVKTVFHLAVIYPYLIPLLESNLFTPFNVDIGQINNFSQIILKEGVKSHNYEEVSYAIYFSLKYNFLLPELTAQYAYDSDNCIVRLLAYLYFDKCNDRVSKKLLKDKAKALVSNHDDFNRNWLFVYEVLPQSDLKDEWKPMKKKGITFVKAL